MKPGELEELKDIGFFTHNNVLLVESALPRLLEEREKALGAIFLLLEDEPEDHDHFGCDRVGAECAWCYARKVYEEARL